MFNYIIRRLLLILPTLLGIMLVSFSIIQFAPGGPVERIVAQLRGLDMGASSKFSGQDSLLEQGNKTSQNAKGDYRGSVGLDPEFIAQLNKQFGFDKPVGERFLKMMKDYLSFNFGRSYYRDIAVIDLIKEKLPVSISLGIWATLLGYFVSIPLGIKKAVRDGSSFDIYSSGIIIVLYAIPGFLFAIFLVVIFGGGNYLDWFPLRGLVSDNFADLSPSQKIIDYLWHIFLPVLALTIGGFATTTLLTKNSFLDEINKQYVTTARAKGLNEGQVLWGHIFSNAMLIIIAGFPAAFIGAFFTGSLLIETIFSLDGLGLLSFESIVNRDYPVVFASTYIFGLIGLAVALLSDLVYVLVDPRIDFEDRQK